MAKKRGGRGTRIFLIIVVFSLLRDAGLNEGFIVALFWLMIIGYAMRGVLFGEKGVLKEGLTTFFENMQYKALEGSQQRVKQNPDHPAAKEVKEKIEQFQASTQQAKERAAHQKFTDAVRATSSDDVIGPATKDYLSGKKSNPFSLDGR